MATSALYCIYDTVAASITGPVWTMKHDAVAIRNFSDIASQKNTGVAQHPRDYSLVCLGYLDEETRELTPDNRIVITGGQWLDMQQQQEASP